MKYLDLCIRELFEKRTVRNLIVRVGREGEVIYDIKRSCEHRELTDTTLFDMASVTKIMATTSLFFIAADRGLISRHDRVSKFFKVPEDKKEMTVNHLLTHTMGIGHKSMLNGEGGYENIHNYILGIPSDVPIGSEVLYSCPGYILLGKILEQVFSERLDKLFLDFIAAPLGMEYTSFLPKRELDIVNSNDSSEECGAVNDYNCRFLGGVAGNAGLFSCVRDIERYVGVLLSCGEPLFSKDIFLEAIKNYTPGMAEDRGLGFIYVGEKYEQTGGLFPLGSFGHIGHTGQSVFVDPKSGLYTVILSDARLCVNRKFGGAESDEVEKMRRDIHAAIKKDMNLSL